MSECLRSAMFSFPRGSSSHPPGEKADNSQYLCCEIIHIPDHKGRSSSAPSYTPPLCSLAPRLAWWFAISKLQALLFKHLVQLMCVNFRYLFKDTAMLDCMWRSTLMAIIVFISLIAMSPFTKFSKAITKFVREIVLSPILFNTLFMLSLL